MSSDEAWAGLTFGPVPEPLRPVFRSALAGEPCEVEALKELRDRLPEGLIEEEGGGEWQEDGEGIFNLTLNWTRAGAETFVDCGLLEVLRSLQVPYDATDDAAGDWDGAEERWRPGMELPFRCRRLDSGDLVMSSYQWALLKRESGGDPAAVLAAVDDLFGTTIEPIAFNWTRLAQVAEALGRPVGRDTGPARPPTV